MKHNFHSGAALMREHQHGALVTPINELFDAFFGAGMGQVVGSDEVRGVMPRVNITDSPDAFTLHMLAPGFTKAELNVNVETNLLTIKAAHKPIALKEGERWTRREFGPSAIQRSFRLPEGVNAEGIRAEHVDGVLSVTLPKREESKPKTFAVHIG
ncbi:MAG: Hsp20/alpha crystallin family protein [Flavobacteriales bacterium]